MPKAFSEQERQIIQQRLLDQGYKLFSTYGLKKTNVEELARAAGISKGAYYAFYPSKEALFMDVVEEAETRLRQEILAAVEQPGPTPRTRLTRVFLQAFAVLETLPVLKSLTGGDFDLLFRRVPPEMLQEHLGSDQVFITALIARCREAGIDIRLQPEQLVGVLYPLVLAAVRDDDPLISGFPGSLDVLLELVAAYSLGEIEI